MKKLVTTLTALVFALGLTASGYTQTTVKPETKPAVKAQTAAAGSQVNPMEKGKGEEAAKPATSAGEKDKSKTDTQVSKKDAAKKPAAPTGETKKEEKKDVIK